MSPTFCPNCAKIVDDQTGTCTVCGGKTHTLPNDAHRNGPSASGADTPQAEKFLISHHIFGSTPSIEAHTAGGREAVSRYPDLRRGAAFLQLLGTATRILLGLGLVFDILWAAWAISRMDYYGIGQLVFLIVPILIAGVLIICFKFAFTFYEVLGDLLVAIADIADNSFKT